MEGGRRLLPCPPTSYVMPGSPSALPAHLATSSAAQLATEGRARKAGALRSVDLSPASHRLLTVAANRHRADRPAVAILSRCCRLHFLQHHDHNAPRSHHTIRSRAFLHAANSAAAFGNEAGFSLCRDLW
jgi:hypothetical protein